jgi:Fe-S cluster assembly scaffold protein SufB
MRVSTALPTGIHHQQSTASHIIRLDPRCVTAETVTVVVDDADIIKVEAAAESQAVLCFLINLNVQECTVHVAAGSASKLTVLTLVEASDTAVVMQRGTLADDATVYWHNTTIGACRRHGLDAELQGANACNTVDWIFFASGQEKSVITATNRFEARGGSGEITMKGIAMQSAHVRCDGMINIGSGGTGTDAYLTENVLMLDPAAKVDAIPGLEIKTNDVKASHSATISRVTAEDLFYFSSRGIPADEARHMYIQAFIGALLLRIQNPIIRDDIGERVAAKFNAVADS